MFDLANDFSVCKRRKRSCSVSALLPERMAPTSPRKTEMIKRVCSSVTLIMTKLGATSAMECFISHEETMLMMWLSACSVAT